MQSPFLVLSLLVMATLQQSTITPPAVHAAAINIRGVSSAERPGQGTVLLAWPGYFYIGDPVISVPAKALVAGLPTRADRFSARVWHDGSRTYFVVYALLLVPRAPNGVTETPIYMSFINVGQQIEIQATERWGAEHVVVTGMAASELR